MFDKHNIVCYNNAVLKWKQEGKTMKLNYKRTILVGFAFFLISAFWQAYDNIVPLILTNKFKMPQTYSGVIMSLDNIFAVVLLPIFGTLSDKTLTKYGKRTPYITIGTVLASLFLILLGFTPKLILFVFVLLAALLSMAIFRSPAVALMPDVTVKPLRSKGNAIINLMGTAGGMLVLGLGIVFKTSTAGKTDFSAYLISVSVVMLTVAFAAASFIKEGVNPIVMYLLFSLAGIGWATINVNSFPMVVELAKNGDVGKYTGFYYTASMSAQIVTPILSGFLIDKIGWHVFFPYAAIFVACAFVTMFFVKHGDSRPETQDALEALAGADD